MKKILLFIILPFFALSQSECQHSFVMNDSFGDGWTGASVSISVDGQIVVPSATINAGPGGTGSTGTITFDAIEGQSIEIDNWVSGTYDEDISWSLYDGVGYALASGVWGQTADVIANCSVPTCLTPAITSWSMGNYDAAFDGTNNESVIQYILEYSTSSFQPGDGTATVFTFEAFPQTLTGLEPSTTYYFAMKSDCGGGDFSNYIGPNSYSTGFVIGCGEEFGIPYGSNATVQTGTNYPVQWEPSQVTDFFLRAITNPGSGVSNTITITGQTEPDYDYVYIVESESGEVLLTPTSGTFNSLEVTGVGELGIYIVSDSTMDSGTNPEYTPVFSVSCQTASLDDLSNNLFTYFPNPVNDQLTIRAQKHVDDITVYNMLGQVVLSQQPNGLDCMVDMAQMQTGAYFVQVSIDNSIETVRVLKN